MQNISISKKTVALVFGLQIGSTGQLTIGKRRDFVRKLGYRFALIYLLPLCFLHLTFLIIHPRFGPASNVEESAYTFTSANNYLKFGFLNSGLLQDFSNSPYPEDHPFVYTHMPAGPDITTALLLWVTEFDYQWTRLFFFLIFILGLFFYIKVIEKIFLREGLSGAGFALIFVWPWVVMQGMERIIYSPFLFFTFAPVALLSSECVGRKKLITSALAAILVFLASIYLEYSLLSGVLVFWILLFMLNLLPGGKRAILLLVIPVLAGIFAHLVQNYIYLGHETFWKEFINVLSNRITGHPSQEELKDWYIEKGLVHHGSKTVSLSLLKTQLFANYDVIGVKSAFLLALVGLVLSLQIKFFPLDTKIFLRLSNRAIRLGGWLMRTAILVGLPVLVPILLFPAFAQEVNLRGSGANSFFLAILGCAALSVTVGEIWRKALKVSSISIVDSALVLQLRKKILILDGSLGMGALVPGITQLLKVMLSIFLTFCLLYIVYFLSSVRLIDYINVARDHYRSKVYHVESLREFKGKMFMTNINVPTIGFLVEYPGFGVCGPESISPQGKVDTTSCKIAFVKRHAYWKEQKPEIFVFFRDQSFFPGFAQCTPNGNVLSKCLEVFEFKLRKNFNVKKENDLFTVFDLTQKPVK